MSAVGPAYVAPCQGEADTSATQWTNDWLKHFVEHLVGALASSLSWPRPGAARPPHRGHLLLAVTALLPLAAHASASTLAVSGGGTICGVAAANGTVYCATVSAASSSASASAVAPFLDFVVPRRRGGLIAPVPHGRQALRRARPARVPPAGARLPARVGAGVPAGPDHLASRPQLHLADAGDPRPRREAQAGPSVVVVDDSLVRAPPRARSCGCSGRPPRRRWGCAGRRRGGRSSTARYRRGQGSRSR
ncbi:hypothetical protein ACP70R_003559 [Stipagrostis hirtigluma subsp. patula]